MNSERATLSIVYTGTPVRVAPDRITDEMFVPNIGRHDPLEADELPGEVAARLFELAEAEAAIVIPDGLRVHCYGDDDHAGAGFILAAYSKLREARAGVTCGWHDVENLTRRGAHGGEDNDPAAVQAALEFMAADINAALNGSNGD